MRQPFASSLLLASLAISPARAQMSVAMIGDRPGHPASGEAACATSSAASTSMTTNVRMDTSIVYSVVGSRLLELDVARPRDLQRRPLVLMLYGSDRGTEMRAPIVALAKRGYVAASAGLRLDGTSDAAPLPQEGGLALRWLRSHADLLGIDVRRVMVLGESSPGDLSLLLGSTAAPALVTPTPSVEQNDDCGAPDDSDVTGRATTILRGTRITAG